jgi:hypothetical protein
VSHRRSRLFNVRPGQSEEQDEIYAAHYHTIMYMKSESHESALSIVHCPWWERPAPPRHGPRPRHVTLCGLTFFWSSSRPCISHVQSISFSSSSGSSAGELTQRLVLQTSTL